MRLSRRRIALALGISTFVLAIGTAFAAFGDWGLEQQTQLQNKSHPLFGVGQPLTESSNGDLDQAQALANPAGLLTVLPAQILALNDRTLLVVERLGRDRILRVDVPTVASRS